MLSKSFLLFSLIFLTSCIFKEGKSTYTEVNMHSAVSEVKIPVDLWDVIEAIYSGEPSTERVLKEGEDEPSPEEKGGTYKVLRRRSKVESSIKFVRFKVNLIESNYGVLGQKDYGLQYGLGGGDLDFAQFVKKQNGSFKIKFEFDVDFADVEDMYVFFWGNGRRRKIDGEMYGSDGKKFVDISSFFIEKVMVRGLQATTHRRKYVTTLAGTYVFILKIEGALYISQLTMHDSRYGAYLLRP